MFLRPLQVILFTAVIVFTSLSLQARTTVAFGYIENRSGNVNYNYLETIFANSLANSLRNVINGVKVIKPLSLTRELKKRNIKLTKNIKPGDFILITKKARADFLVTGNFIPRPRNQVEITLNIHFKKQPFYYTFTTTGRMETEIFRLVDRISSVMVYYMTKKRLYKTAKIPQGRTIGVLTNIEGSDMNDLYLNIGSRGYRLSSLQGNEARAPIVNKKNVGHLYYITTRDASFEVISDARKHFFPLGTWSSQRFGIMTKETKEMVLKYDDNYLTTFNSVMDRFRTATGSDYLLIVAFNGTGTRAWLRCVDLNRKELIWMQSNIKGSSVYDISKIIARNLNLTASEIAVPVSKKKKTKK